MGGGDRVYRGSAGKLVFDVAHGDGAAVSRKKRAHARRCQGKWALATSCDSASAADRPFVESY